MSFFKNTWFKCIACLLSIFLIAGGGLAILSNVLAVSPEERTARALSKIYDTAVSVDNDDILVDVDSNDSSKNSAYSTPYGNINKIFKVDQNVEDNSFDMVFQATGNNGYKGGTITLWIKVVYLDNKPQQIDKVILESNKKQTLMSKLTNDFYNKFNLTDVTAEYNQGKFFTANNNDQENIKNPVSGATMSANAGCNAVNCVLYYTRLGGEQ